MFDLLWLKRKSIAVRLSLLFLIGALFIGGTLFFRFSNDHEQIQLGSLEDKAQIMCLTAAGPLERSFNNFHRMGRDLALLVQTLKPDLPSLRRVVGEFFRGSRNLSAISIIFFPLGETGPQRTSLKWTKGFGGASGPPPEPVAITPGDRYRNPQEWENPCWKEFPGEGQRGTKFRFTFHAPIFAQVDTGKRVIGVIAMDFALEGLREHIRKISFAKEGFLFLISPLGHYLYNPNTEAITDETIFENARKIANSHLQTVAKDMTEGGRGFTLVENFQDSEDYYLSYLPLSSGCSLGVVFPAKKFMAQVRGETRMLATMGGIAILLFLLLVFLLARSITRPLDMLTNAADAFARGKLGDACLLSEHAAKEGLAITDADALGSGENLQNHLEEKARGEGVIPDNEILRLFCAFTIMGNNLKGFLARVIETEKTVSDFLQKLAGATNSLEEAVAEQMESTLKVNLHSKNIKATADDLASSMEELSLMAGDAAEMAALGVEHVERMNKTMQAILSANQGISEKFRVIRVKSDNVSQVITTITKVANRINLLSLNAAMEAEKAGEHGKGFSVVASEIRKLADQTAVAVIDIEEIIGAVQKSISDGEKTVNSFAVDLDSSSVVIEKAGRNLSCLIDYTRNLGPQFEEANRRMKAQSQCGGEISEQMDLLSTQAKIQDMAIRENRDLIQNLKESANRLHTEVSRFSVE